jgi:hypothetical protein
LATEKQWFAPLDAQQQKTLPSPSPAADDVAKSGFHRSECREVPEWSEIADQFRDPGWVYPELPPASRSEAAGVAQKAAQGRLGIREILYLRQSRQYKRISASWIARGPPDRGLIEQQPSFLHSDRNHANRRDFQAAERSQCLPDLVFPRLTRLALGIAMDE